MCPLIIFQTSLILGSTWLITSRVNEVKITVLVGTVPYFFSSCLFSSFMFFLHLLAPCTKLNRAVWGGETYSFPAIVPTSGKGSIIQGGNTKGPILASSLNHTFQSSFIDNNADIFTWLLCIFFNSESIKLGKKCGQLASSIPNIRCLGWKIARTDSGRNSFRSIIKALWKEEERERQDWLWWNLALTQSHKMKLKLKLLILEH